jgi:hypothetical protein
VKSAVFLICYQREKPKRLFCFMIIGVHGSRFSLNVDNLSDYEFLTMFDPYSTGMNVDMRRGLCSRYKMQNDTSNKRVILLDRQIGRVLFDQLMVQGHCRHAAFRFCLSTTNTSEIYNELICNMYTVLFTLHNRVYL